MDKIFNGRILREETVPVHATTRHGNGAEKLRDGRRGQHAVDAEVFSGEQLEVTAKHLHSANSDDWRTRPPSKLPKLVEIKIPIEHVAKPILTPSWKLVRTNLGKNHDVAKFNQA